MTEGPGARPGREPENAEFAVARVGGRERGGRSLLAIVGFVGVLVAMIAVAIGTRAPDIPGGGALPTLGTPTGASATAGTGGALPVPSFDRAGISFAPLVSSDPVSTQIRLTAQRQPSTVFVHGDVFVAKVTWVFVSLRDESGQVGGWSSVSVPGAAGPGVDGGPTMRFDVELAVPAAFAGALTVQATAYDGTGTVIGSTQLVMSGAVAARPPAIGRANAAVGVVPVTLYTPTGREGAITGSTVPVEGQLAIYASTLHVALEGSRQEQFDTVIFDTGADGALRWDRVPTFHVDLALPSPRPVGQVWVVITAYDRTGQEIGVVRRTVLIGPAA
jgi:hypothetical protein